jgi:hypothetical protein
VSSKGLRRSKGRRAPGGGGAPGAGELQVAASGASSAGEQGELRGPPRGAPACCPSSLDDESVANPERQIGGAIDCRGVIHACRVTASGWCWVVG